MASISEGQSSAEHEATSLESHGNPDTPSPETRPSDSSAQAEEGPSGVVFTSPSGPRRRPSFCHTDTQKYRHAFDEYIKKPSSSSGGELAKDIQKAALYLGYKLTEQQTRDIIKNNDITGELTFDQFLDIIPRNTAEISKDQHRLADLREKFQRYDLDQNGFISLSEAQWALQVELDVSNTTALRLLNQFVKLDYEHFVDFYRRVQDKKMELYEKFGQYDRDLDGLISVEEAHIILQKELGFTQDRSRAMVNRFDINKDGRVSYVEFAEFYIAVEERKARIRQAFKEFDCDNAGFVKLDQARLILQGYLGFSEEKAKQTVALYDSNKDGHIDYEEFLQFYSMIEEERQRLLTEFHRYDADGDGQISVTEFREMLTSQGYSPRDVDAIMSGYDDDHDGFLSFDEFRKFLNFS